MYDENYRPLLLFEVGKLANILSAKYLCNLLKAGPLHCSGAVLGFCLMAPGPEALAGAGLEVALCEDGGDAGGVKQAVIVI